MLILELRDTSLQLILADYRSAKIKVRKTLDLSMGESLKGYASVADNLTQLTKAIKHFTQDRTAVLCLNTSTVIYRDMVVPKASPKYLATLIRHELTYALNLSPDYLLDYTILGEVEKNGKKQNKILVATLPATGLQEILEVLTKLDLNVTSIDVGLNAVLKYGQFTKLIQAQKTVLMADVHDGGVRQYLIEKGQYAFNRSTKLLGGSTLKDRLSEAIDPIEKMVQFNRSASTNAIDSIALFGSFAQLDELALTLSEQVDIPATIITAPPQITLKTQKFDPDLVIGLGTLISLKHRRKKDLNLLVPYNLYFNKQRALVDLDRLHKTLSYALVYGAVFAFIFMNIRANLLSAQIDASKAYLNQEEVKNTLAEIESMREELAIIREINAEIDSIQGVLDRIPRLDGLQITTVLDLKPTGLRLVSINYANTLLSLTFSTRNPNLIYPYVLTLETLDAFEEVSYQSYTCAKDECLVTLDVSLKGGENE